MNIAIIGHGPSPAGKGWGPQIDSCDRVIRMWDCHWQAPADYGTRYDIGVFTVHPIELAPMRELCERRPAEWWAYDHRGIGRGGYIEPLAEPQRRIDPAGWIARGRAMGGGSVGRLYELTRGTAAALAALEWLRPARLVLVGFDSVEAGAIQKTQCAPDAVAVYRARGTAVHVAANIGRARTATHDYPTERRLIEAAAGDSIAWGFE